MLGLFKATLSSTYIGLGLHVHKQLMRVTVGFACYEIKWRA